MSALNGICKTTVAGAIFTATLALSACSNLESNSAPETAAPASAKTKTASQKIELKSSDYNLASALLFQWWGVFEAPKSIDVSANFDKLFADDVHLMISKLDVTGVDKVKAIFTGLPAGELSHDIQDIRVTPLGNNLFDLEADFLFQSFPENQPHQSGRTRYKHKIKKQADGSFVFTEITGEVLENFENTDFKTSYIENRARAAILQYLGITDKLEGDYSELTQVMSESSEVHGMFDPQKAAFNARGDGALIGLTEISNWLSSRKATFSRVAHKLTDITIVPLSDNHYEASISVATQAWLLAGGHIDVLIPIKITLADNGGQFMQIKRIDR